MEPELIVQTKKFPGIGHTLLLMLLAVVLLGALTIPIGVASILLNETALRAVALRTGTAA